MSDDDRDIADENSHGESPTEGEKDGSLEGSLIDQMQKLPGLNSPPVVHYEPREEAVPEWKFGAAQGDEGHPGAVDQSGDDEQDIESLLARMFEKQSEHDREFSQLHSQLDSITRRVQRFEASIGRELDGMRQELLGERKSNVHVRFLQSLVPWLRSLKSIRATMSSSKEQLAYGHLENIISMIETMLMSMGFREFMVNKGEPFDPEKMQVTGFAEGDHDVVL